MYFLLSKTSYRTKNKYVNSMLLIAQIRYTKVWCFFEVPVLPKFESSVAIPFYVFLILISILMFVDDETMLPIGFF